MFTNIVAGLALLLSLILGIYIAGKNSWGKISPNPRTRFFFKVYLLFNRMNLLKRKGNWREVMLLNLIKVHNEITHPNYDFIKAQRVINSTSTFELVDIYDDQIGHRYVKMKSKYHGELIYTIEEYLSVAYNRKIKDREISYAGKEDRDKVKALETKARLKVIK